MANRIKGITIEIGGNTTKLESALKDVNKVVYETNKELKEMAQFTVLLCKALKNINPGS